MKKLIFTLFCVAVLVGLTMPISPVASSDETVTEAWVARYDGPGNHEDILYDMVVGSLGETARCTFSQANRE